MYDFLHYIIQIRRVGGVSKIINKLPNFGINADSLDNEKLFHMEAIINSMIVKERINPNIIKESIKKSIAVGSGLKIRDVTNLLNMFNVIFIL